MWRASRTTDVLACPNPGRVIPFTNPADGLRDWRKPATAPVSRAVVLLILSGLGVLGVVLMVGVVALWTVYTR